MKRLLLSIGALVMLMGMCCAQEIHSSVRALLGIADAQGTIIQYATVGVGFFSFDPSKQRDEYRFQGKTPYFNGWTIQTVDGVSQLYLIVTEDQVCSNSCTYLGTLTNLQVQDNYPALPREGGNLLEIYGDAIGTFVDPFGVTHEDVPAHFSVLTWPSVDGINVMGPDSVIIELAPN